MACVNQLLPWDCTPLPAGLFALTRCLRFKGGLCGRLGVGALSTVDSAPHGAVWLPVGHLLPTGCNGSSISPQSYPFTGTPR